MQASILPINFSKQWLFHCNCNKGLWQKTNGLDSPSEPQLWTPSTAGTGPCPLDQPFQACPSQVQGGPCWKDQTGVTPCCGNSEATWGVEHLPHSILLLPALPPSLGITQDGASRCTREEVYRMPLRTVHRWHLMAAWTLVPLRQSPECIKELLSLCQAESSFLRTE